MRAVASEGRIFLPWRRRQQRRDLFPHSVGDAPVGGDIGPGPDQDVVWLLLRYTSSRTSSSTNLSNAPADLPPTPSGIETEGSEPRQVQVAGRAARAHAAFVLPEGHVQDLVQAVFNPPVCPRRRQQVSGLGGMAGDEVAGFGANLVSHPCGQCRQHQDVRQVVQLGPVARILGVSRISTRDEGIGLSMRGSPQVESGTAHCSLISSGSPTICMQSPCDTTLKVVQYLSNLMSRN